MNNLNVPEGVEPASRSEKASLFRMTESTRNAIAPLLFITACVGSHVANFHVRRAARDHETLQEVLKALDALDYFPPAGTFSPHNYFNGDPYNWDKK